IARLAGVEPSDNVACFAPDSKTLAIAYRNNPAIAIFDIPSGKKRFPGPHNSARGLAFSHDGRSLASFTAWNPVRIWDARTGQEKSQAPWPAMKGTFTSQVFWGANDKVQVLVALFDKDRIYEGLQLIDMETSNPIRSFTKKDGKFGACAVSADGQLLAQCVGD